MGLFSGLKKIAGAVGGIAGGLIGGPVGASIGGALGNALAGSISGKKAANAQVASANAAIGESRRQFDVTRADHMPWMDAGKNALANLRDPEAFTASPSYGFRRSEGTREIEQTAAARGGAYSGNALRALAEFNSSLASEEYGNWWNREATIAGMGRDAATTVGSFGADKSARVGSATMAAGDARASGIIAKNNALSDGVSTAIDTWNYGRNALPRATGGGWSGGWRTPPIRSNF